MRVILVGSEADVGRLRTGMSGTAIEIIGEARTLAEARAIARNADAFLIARSKPFEDQQENSPFEESLTPREIQILELLAEGLSNRSIAARLGISDQTVKFHLAIVFDKLGAANRTDAVRRGVRRGIIAL